MRRTAALFLAALAFVTPAAAQTIDQLQAGGAVQSTDLYPTFQTSSPAKRVTAAQMKTFMQAGGNTPIGVAGGDLTGSYPNPTLANVNANTGAFGSATQCVSVTYDAKGRATAVSQTTCTPAVGSITGFASGVAAWLAAPSSANLAAAMTDKTGTGVNVFGTAPTISSLNATVGMTLAWLTGAGTQCVTVSNTGAVGAQSCAAGGSGVSQINNGTTVAVSTGGNPCTTSCTLDLAPIAAQSLYANNTGSSAIPGVVTCPTGGTVGRNGSGNIGCQLILDNNIFSGAAIAISKLANGTANTVMGALTAAAHQDLAVPSCSAAGQALQWVSGTGFSCGAVPVAANPTATAGPTAINGSANTFMRSDGAPAVQLGTNAQKGIVQGDGIGINCASGACTLINSMSTNKVQYAQGSGTSGTFTTPSGALWIKLTIRAPGGGGGGGGTGSFTTGGTGGLACVNTSGAACTTPLWAASGGVGGNLSGTGGTGGAGQSGSSACTYSQPGANGNAAQPIITGFGASGQRGGGAGGGDGTYQGAGLAGVAGTGGGGQGGGQSTASSFGGAGGGEGGLCEVYLPSPAGSYTWALQAPGTGGGAGTSGNPGAPGGNGLIKVEYGFN